MRTMACAHCWGKAFTGHPCPLCNDLGVVPDEQLSRHFRLSEMLESATARARGIPNDPLADHLVNMRQLCQTLGDTVADHFGGLRLSSGYRSPALNAAVRGRPTGAHPLGEAMDVHASNGAPVSDVVAFASNCGFAFDQVLWESKLDADGNPTMGPWCHIGLRNSVGLQRRQVLMTFDTTTFEPFDPNDSRIVALSRVAA